MNTGRDIYLVGTAEYLAASKAGREPTKVWISEKAARLCTTIANAIDTEEDMESDVVVFIPGDDLTTNAIVDFARFMELPATEDALRSVGPEGATDEGERRWAAYKSPEIQRYCEIFSPEEMYMHITMVNYLGDSLMPLVDGMLYSIAETIKKIGNVDAIRDFYKVTSAPVRPEVIKEDARRQLVSFDTIGEAIEHSDKIAARRANGTLFEEDEEERQSRIRQRRV